MNEVDTSNSPSPNSQVPGTSEWLRPSGREQMPQYTSIPDTQQTPTGRKGDRSLRRAGRLLQHHSWLTVLLMKDITL